MIDQINTLIALNMNLLHQAMPLPTMLKDFRNKDNAPLQGAKILADIMQQKELIRLHPEREQAYELTALGLQICETGGWLAYLDTIKNQTTENTISLAPVNRKHSRKHYLELVIAGLIILFLSVLIVSCL